MMAPNFMRAYQSLQAIRPDLPIRFVPVTREVRHKAYAVSPAFRELAPFLDGERENWGAWWTRTTMGIDGEIGAGWFYWTLVEAAAKAGHFKTAWDAEAYFGRVADEITAASNDGRLPSRLVLLPFIDPTISLWLTHVPSSFVKLARHVFPSTRPALPGIPVEVAYDVVTIFDRVANRRSSASKPPSYIAQGWVLSSPLRPAAIQIADLNGEPVRTLFQAHRRPDVEVIVDPSGQRGPPALGFNIDWPAERFSLERVRLKVLLEDGKSALSVPLSAFPIGVAVRLAVAEDGPALYVALDRLDKPLRSRREAVTAFIADWYQLALALLAVLSVIRLAFTGSVRTCFRTPQMIVVLFVLSIIASRLLFFAVLDASAWSAVQTRYLFPVAIVVAVCPAILFTFGRRPATVGKWTEQIAGVAE